MSDKDIVDDGGLFIGFAGGGSELFRVIAGTASIRFNWPAIAELSETAKDKVSAGLSFTEREAWCLAMTQVRAAAIEECAVIADDWEDETGGCVAKDIRALLSRIKEQA